MKSKLVLMYSMWLLTGLMICIKTVLWARETLTPKVDIRRTYSLQSKRGTATDDN